MSDTSDTALCFAHSRGQADEWALVLAAEGLSPIVRSELGHFVVHLPLDQLSQRERALASLAAYAQENPPSLGAPSSSAVPPLASSQAGTVVVVALFAFFLVTGPRVPGSPWFEQGAADAHRILMGESWRTITALTLHADLAHVAANAILGAVLFNWVCGSWGAGMGMLAILAGGAGGNWLNAYAYSAFHSSVGASTAVFAALGLLCGPAVVQRQQRGARGWRLLAPLAAGLGLLAMLGVGGPRTDIWAHLFGLVCGGALGIPLAYAYPSPPGPRTQTACGLAAIAVTMVSWWSATRWI